MLVDQTTRRDIHAFVHEFREVFRRFITRVPLYIKFSMDTKGTLKIVRMAEEYARNADGMIASRRPIRYSVLESKIFLPDPDQSVYDFIGAVREWMREEWYPVFTERFVNINPLSPAEKAALIRKVDGPSLEEIATMRKETITEKGKWRPDFILSSRRAMIVNDLVSGAAEYWTLSIKPYVLLARARSLESERPERVWALIATFILTREPYRPREGSENPIPGMQQWTDLSEEEEFRDL